MHPETKDTNIPNTCIYLFPGKLNIMPPYMYGTVRLKYVDSPDSGISANPSNYS